MRDFQTNSTCLTGNCQFCGEKGDCVLLAILEKVKKLENALEKITGHAVT
jgi:hypothetical protein